MLSDIFSYCFAECCYAGCHYSGVIMLGVINLGVIMPGVIILGVTFSFWFCHYAECHYTKCCGAFSGRFVEQKLVLSSSFRCDQIHYCHRCDLGQAVLYNLP